ncbi:hypothetical protein [Lentzea waywayandensis]|nr:hypothetical protein [Lentzea waywayandensis]
METARQALAVLVGERWRYAGRACDLVWLGFGPDVEVTDLRGGTREVAEYSLHLQCSWQVFAGEKRVAGSGDVYLPPRGWSGDGDFDWDVQGTNRFDVRAAELATFLADEEIVVTSVEVSGRGDLTVFLSDDLRIEAPRGDTDAEDWRFFRPGTDGDHVVMPPED